MPETYGYEVPTDQALRTLDAVFEGPINFLDTAGIYAYGESERRIGAALQAQGGLPDGFVLATKADRDPETGDFSGTQVLRSVEQSLEHLGVAHLQLVYLHDPEHTTFAAAAEPGGPLDVLVRLRSEGVIGHLGVAGGPVDLLAQYLGTGVFDVLLTHNRFSLLDRSANGLIDAAHNAGVGVINAAPFGGGVLAQGTGARSSYGYKPLDEDFELRLAGMAAACERHAVDLAAAALQFSLRDPRIVSTVVGISRPERIDATLALASQPIPADLWAELEEFALDRDDERADQW
ncbi:MAG: aldo/keto reductase [Actinobacteria bacterium]|nr:aldo/keto reductase [Actinomycetota bacterium]